MCVNLDYLYGIKPDPSTNFAITYPKLDKLKLILVPSLNRYPVAPVFSTRSDPAKSTKLSLPTWILAPF